MNWWTRKILNSTTAMKLVRMSSYLNSSVSLRDMILKSSTTGCLKGKKKSHLDRVLFLGAMRKYSQRENLIILIREPLRNSSKPHLYRSTILRNTIMKNQLTLICSSPLTLHLAKALRTKISNNSNLTRHQTIPRGRMINNKISVICSNCLQSLKIEPQWFYKGKKKTKLKQT